MESTIAKPTIPYHHTQEERAAVPQERERRREQTMSHPQFTKFSPITVLVKRTIRKLRIDAGHSMNEGARLLGVSRKQLEDIETFRNYGCHLDLELLAKIKVIYRASLDDIVGDLPDDCYSEYFERPRKRANSSDS